MYVKGSEIPLNEWYEKFSNGDFDSSSLDVQLEAGWYDWFCKDNQLVNKTRSLGKKVVWMVDNIIDKKYLPYIYCFFKNNCPIGYSLYDDFRLVCFGRSSNCCCFTIIPSCPSDEGKRSEVWSVSNNFSEPFITAENWTSMKKILKQKKDEVNKIINNQIKREIRAFEEYGGKDKLFSYIQDLYNKLESFKPKSESMIRALSDMKYYLSLQDIATEAELLYLWHISDDFKTIVRNHDPLNSLALKVVDLIEDVKLGGYKYTCRADTFDINGSVKLQVFQNVDQDRILVSKFEIDRDFNVKNICGDMFSKELLQSVVNYAVCTI